MRTQVSLVIAASFLLLSVPRAIAEENPEQQAINALQKLGARCEVDASLPGHPVVAVTLDHSYVHGEAVKLLKRFPRLQSVTWRGDWSIGQEDLKVLGTLTQLRRLDIWAWRVQDDWLTSLEGLSNLESLTLYWGEELTDDGLRHLRRLSALRSLNLHKGIHITDRGLVHLRGLTNLRHLNLGGTEIGDKGLVCLKHFSHLETLNIAYTKVGDNGLVYLKDLSNLRCLDLIFTKITKKGLKLLKGLTALQNLKLDADIISGDALEDFKELKNLRGYTERKPLFTRLSGVVSDT